MPSYLPQPPWFLFSLFLKLYCNSFLSNIWMHPLGDSLINSLHGSWPDLFKHKYEFITTTTIPLLVTTLQYSLNLIKKRKERQTYTQNKMLLNMILGFASHWDIIITASFCTVVLHGPHFPCITTSASFQALVPTIIIPKKAFEMFSIWAVLNPFYM